MTWYYDRPLCTLLFYGLRGFIAPRTVIFCSLFVLCTGNIPTHCALRNTSLLRQNRLQLVSKASELSSGFCASCAFYCHARIIWLRRFCAGIKPCTVVIPQCSAYGLNTLDGALSALGFCVGAFA